MLKTPIPYETLKKTIEGYSHPNSYVAARTQALMAFQYVLGCRSGELVPYLHPAHTNKKGFTRPAFMTVGLLKSQIREYPTHWEITIPNFKQEKNNIKVHYKTGIISKNPEEKWLSDICFGWLPYSPYDIVFPLAPITARLTVSEALHSLGKELKSNSNNRWVASHHLRDSRADHLYKLKNFSLVEIKETLGHSSLATTSVYLGSDIAERVKKLNAATVQK